MNKLLEWMVTFGEANFPRCHIPPEPPITPTAAAGDSDASSPGAVSNAQQTRRWSRVHCGRCADVNRTRCHFRPSGLRKYRSAR